jgi:hypothetical protein
MNQFNPEPIADKSSPGNISGASFADNSSASRSPDTTLQELRQQCSGQSRKINELQELVGRLESKIRVLESHLQEMKLSVAISVELRNANRELELQLKAARLNNEVLEQLMPFLREKLPQLYAILQKVGAAPRLHDLAAKSSPEELDEALKAIIQSAVNALPGYIERRAGVFAELEAAKSSLTTLRLELEELKRPQVVDLHKPNIEAQVLHELKRSHEGDPRKITRVFDMFLSAGAPTSIDRLFYETAPLLNHIYLNILNKIAEDRAHASSYLEVQTKFEQWLCGIVERLGDPSFMPLLNEQLRFVVLGKISDSLFKKVLMIGIVDPEYRELFAHPRTPILVESFSPSLRAAFASVSGEARQALQILFGGPKFTRAALHYSRNSLQDGDLAQVTELATAISLMPNGAVIKDLIANHGDMVTSYLDFRRAALLKFLI